MTYVVKHEAGLLTDRGYTSLSGQKPLAGHAADGMLK